MTIPARMKPTLGAFRLGVPDRWLIVCDYPPPHGGNCTRSARARNVRAKDAFVRTAGRSTRRRQPRHAKANIAVAQQSPARAEGSGRAAEPGSRGGARWGGRRERHRLVAPGACRLPGSSRCALTPADRVNPRFRVAPSRLGPDHAPPLGCPRAVARRGRGRGRGRG